MKNIELCIINRRTTTPTTTTTLPQEIYETPLLANFFFLVRVLFCFSLFQSVSLTVASYFHFLCYLEYIILNWRLLLFFSKLVIMLILVLALLFLLIDPLYMNLSSKHSIKNMKRSVNFMLT